MPTAHTIRIDSRFQGPPRSGNGGYACGRIAEALDPGHGDAVAVRLHAPPPLDTDLQLERDGDVARLLDGDRLVGEARCSALTLEVPPAPTPEAAVRASSAFIGFQRHQFPHCFVCGPGRAVGDGLRIFAGPLDGSAVLAAPWAPDSGLAVDGVLPDRCVWAALDCPSGFAHEPLPVGVGIVLGELCVERRAPIPPGQACTVLAWPMGVSGRKRFAGSALYGADGALLARARATWIDIDLAAWR